MTQHRMFALALAGALLAGCASTPVKQAVLRPAWVLKGSGAYAADATTVFYGVGVANPMPNIALQRRMSDERAREEVATTLKTSVKSMVKDYMDHHVDYFNSDTAGSDEFSAFVSKSVVDQELVDCRIIDHWQDPDTGAFYALARMDANSKLFDQYQQSLKDALRAQHGAVLKARADEAIKDLDKAVQEQRDHEKALLGATEPAPPVDAPTAPDAVP